jgi:hypothetical protein
LEFAATSGTGTTTSAVAGTATTGDVEMSDAPAITPAIVPTGTNSGSGGGSGGGKGKKGKGGKGGKR